MAQNVSLWGASYSNVPSIEVPKTGGGTAQFDDTTIDSGAAGAADITLNKKAWVNGVLLTGTNQGGGGTEAGTVTQDANGFLVLDDDPPAGPTLITKSITANGTYNASSDNADGYSSVTVNVSGGGGLVYETGTWTPATDSEGYFINFANSHTTAPFYYAIWCVSSFVSSSSGGVIYSNVHQAIGEPLHTSASGLRYGYAQKIISSGANSISNLSYPYTNQGDSSGSYSRYWAKETGINAPQYSSGYPWRAGSTYKWIAVWAPTS